MTNPLNGVVGADDPATFSVTSSPATLTIFDGTAAQVTLLRDIYEPTRPSSPTSRMLITAGHTTRATRISSS